MEPYFNTFFPGDVTVHHLLPMLQPGERHGFSDIPSLPVDYGKVVTDPLYPDRILCTACREKQRRLKEIETRLALLRDESFVASKRAEGVQGALWTVWRNEMQEYRRLREPEACSPGEMCLRNV
jgi:hypothetical protein